MKTEKINLTVVILISLLLGLSSYAQVIVNLQEPPPNQWNTADLWRLTLTNTSTETQEIYLYGTVEEETRGLVFEATSGVFELEGNETKSVSQSDIEPVDIGRQDDEVKTILERTGNLPEGNWEICVSVIENGNGEIGRDCYDLNIAHLTPPQLLAPENEASVEDEFPVFIWLPPMPQPVGEPVSYSLKIVEILGDQLPQEAMESNPAFFEQEDIRATSFQYSITARRFEEGQTYAWQITAYAGDDLELGRSEVWKFSHRGQKACQCDKWDFLKAVAGTQTESILPCGSKIIYINSGTQATIKGSYLCDPPNFFTCPVTYQWWWWEYDPQTPQIHYDTDESKGQVIKCDFDIVFDDAPCCTVWVRSFCNGVMCEECEFKVCRGDCDCGDWDPVDLSWTDNTGSPQSWTGSCGQTVSSPITINPGSPIELNTSHICNPSPPCSSVYTWEVNEVGPGQPFTDAGSTLPVTFTLPAFSVGWNTIEVVINADCDGTPCPPCTTIMRVNVVDSGPDTCDCGEWDPVDLSWTDNTGSPQNWMGSCGDMVPGITVNPGSQIELNTDYVCSPNTPPCTPNYFWEARDVLSGNTLIDDGTTLPVQFILPSTYTGMNTIEVVINVDCNGTPCPPCTTTMRVNVVDSGVDTCDCDHWDPVDLSWTDNTGSPQNWMGSCGDMVPGITVNPGSQIELNTDYVCSPNTPPCTPNYFWEARDVLSGNTLIDDGTTLPVQFILPSTYTGMNTIEVVINVDCNGTPCPPCTTTMRVQVDDVDTCDCGEWNSLNVMWNGNTQSMLASIFPCFIDTVKVPLNTSVDFEGEYLCSGCQPTYNYHVTDPLGSQVINQTNQTDLNGSFIVNQAGCYIVAYEVFCGTQLCSACSFAVCTDAPPPVDTCGCGGWQNMEIAWGGNSNLLPCDPSGTNTIAVTPGANVQIEGNYQCLASFGGGPCPDYYWYMVEDASGNDIVLSPNIMPGLDKLDFSFPFPGTECYTVTIGARCSNKTCETCKFQICPDDVPDCDCGEWNSLNVMWNGNTQSMLASIFPCFIDTVKVPLNTSVDFEGEYLCSGCQPTYNYHVTDPLGSQVINQTNQTDLDGSFIVNQTGCYIVAYEVFCGTQLCSACSFAVCTDAPPPVDTCGCGDWQNMEIAWGGNSQNLLPCNHLGNQTVDVTPGANIHISGDYQCLVPLTPPGAIIDCDVTYSYSVTNVSNGNTVSSGSMAGNFELDFPFPGTDCYEVTVSPGCGPKNCHTCKFQICPDSSPPDDACICEITHLYFGHNEVQENSTSQIPDVPGGIQYAFNFDYECTPPTPTCVPRYPVWEITKPDGTTSPPDVVAPMGFVYFTFNDIGVYTFEACVTCNSLVYGIDDSECCKTFHVLYGRTDIGPPDDIFNPGDLSPSGN